jgi:hypothetical protein
MTNRAQQCVTFKIVPFTFTADTRGGAFGKVRNSSALHVPINSGFTVRLFLPELFA